jgi:hypothetical protein
LGPRFRPDCVWKVARERARIRASYWDLGFEIWIGAELQTKAALETTRVDARIRVLYLDLGFGTSIPSKLLIKVGWETEEWARVRAQTRFSCWDLEFRTWISVKLPRKVAKDSVCAWIRVCWDLKGGHEVKLVKLK